MHTRIIARRLGIALGLFVLAPHTRAAIILCNASAGITSGQPNPVDKSDNETGSPAAGAHAAQFTMSAGAAAGGSSTSNWFIRASSSVVATHDNTGPTAIATASAVSTDNITVRADHIPNGHQISFKSHLSIDGITSGSSSPPGFFAAAVSVQVDYLDHGAVFFTGFSGSQSVDTNGVVGSIPNGDVSWSFLEFTGDNFDQRITLSASALCFAIEDQGQAEADTDYSSTFRWGEVTDVFDVTTQQPIPARDFHLIGADGFDWAHPSVPEPSTVVPALCGLVLLLRRRR